MAFVPFNGEIDILPSLHERLEVGPLALPGLDNLDIQPLCVERPLEGQLRRHAFGQQEPDPAQCPLVDLQDIDLVILPAVGWDVHGHRLGLGRGCYDRFLARLPSVCRCVGVGYEFQVLEHIPVDAHDTSVEEFLTDQGVYHCRATRVTSHRERDTRSLAEHLAEVVSPGFRCALRGPVGAGKTLFANALARALGAQAALVSQSYLLAAEVATTRGLLAHLDGYRLTSARSRAADVEQLSEYVDRAAFLLVEWAEHQPGLLPADITEIEIMVGPDSRRLMTLRTCRPEQWNWHEGWKV
jgi:5-formyltetrahydrofolate cyclo-ligase